MLPKRNRFTTEDFKTMRTTRTLHAPHLFVRIAATSPKKGKAAVIVSSATYKKAVERNLLRRRIYHVIRKHPLLMESAFTVTVKKGARELPFAELESELLNLFRSPALPPKT